MPRGSTPDGAKPLISESTSPRPHSVSLPELLARALGVQAGRHGPYEGIQRILYGVGAGAIVECRNDPLSPSSRAQSETSWRVELTTGSRIMFVAHLFTAITLGSLGTYRAWEFEKRLPFSPYHNLTATEIKEATLAGVPYTSDEIFNINTHPWSLTYFRLSAYLAFVVLSVLLHCLVLSVSRYDPIAMAIRKRQNVQQVAGQFGATDRSSLWTTDAKDSAEVAAKDLCLQLWIPIVLGAALVILIGDTEAMGGRVGSAVLSDFFPILTIAAATLLLGTIVATVKKHVENLMATQDHQGDLNQLLTSFRRLAIELQDTAWKWSWILGTQVLLTCALIVNATASLLGSHGYQISLLTGDPLNKSMALMYLVQTVPVLWSLWLSFDTVISLNTYLDEIPLQISHNCIDKFDMAMRDHFANEYARLGVHLSVPFLGEVTKTTRFHALLSFATMLSLVMTFPGQVIQALDLNKQDYGDPASIATADPCSQVWDSSACSQAFTISEAPDPVLNGVYFQRPDKLCADSPVYELCSGGYVLYRRDSRGNGWAGTWIVGPTEQVTDCAIWPSTFEDSMSVMTCGPMNKPSDCAGKWMQSVPRGDPRDIGGGWSSETSARVVAGCG
eukprot:COSAG02_NODE_1573_length_11882_cov_5.506832_4_plen_617_part_00